MHCVLTKTLIIGVAACCGCGGATPTSLGADAGIIGTYELSPNATSFVVLQQPNYKFEMIGGTFTIAGDFTWTFRINFQQTTGTQVNKPVRIGNGSYKIESGSPTFTDAAGVCCVSIVPSNNQMIVLETLPITVARAPDGRSFSILAIFAK